MNCFRKCETSISMTYQIFSTGVDSFALKMKNGKRIAKMQPL